MKSYHFPFFLEWTILFAAAKMIDDHFINEFGTESKKKKLYTGNQQSTEMFYTMKYSHYEIFPS